MRFGAALLLGVILFSFSGLARVLLGASLMQTPRRRVCAEYYVGGLVYAALFSTAFQLGLPTAVFTPIAGVGACLGLLGIRHEFTSPGRPFVRIQTAILLIAALAILSFVPANWGAADPINYAFMGATALEPGWLSAQAQRDALPEVARFVRLRDLGALSRAPEIGLVWPFAALWAIDASVVTQVSTWMLLIAVALLADTMAALARPGVAVTLALGGIGLLNAESALIGGQLNQPFALITVLGMLWVSRFHFDERRRFLVFCLATYLVVSGYPEFVLALPLYLGCIAIVSRNSARAVIRDGAAMASGFGLVLLGTRGDVFEYLTNQSASAPYWRPLGLTQGSLPEAWAAMLLLPPSRLWPQPAWARTALAAASLVACYGWVRQMAPRPDLPSFGWPGFLAGLVLVGGWSWVIRGSPNSDYAAFKIGGWIGPGLVLFAWVLANKVRGPLARVVVAAVVFIALVRTAALIGDTVIAVQRQLRDVPNPVLWRLAQVEDGAPHCVVEAVSSRVDVVLRTVAESAAPERGCSFAVSHAPRDSAADG
jgi:hypothetical protein